MSLAYKVTPDIAQEFYMLSSERLKQQNPKVVDKLHKLHIKPSSLRSAKVCAQNKNTHRGIYASYGGDTRARLRAKLAKQ